MGKVLNLTYSSSLTELKELNSSFDSGILRIAYPGVNRNKSSISKDAFEKCIKTIYNCPVVCNYDRETDTLGGHDQEVVRDKSGELKLVNLTTPIGCIPESSKVFWETVTEEDGTERDYLCAEALLWKRQEAYQSIRNGGVTSQSMEISVKDGEIIDGIYNIYDFEFTAFALIGVEPCFESAALEFSKQSFKEQMNAMMDDMKRAFSEVEASKEEDIDKNENTVEGGEGTLENENIAEAKLDEQELENVAVGIDVNEDIQQAELAEEGAQQSQGVKGPETDGADGAFSLASVVAEEIYKAVQELELYTPEWSKTECPVYYVQDYDTEAHLVYCLSEIDWKVYRFEYAMNGDFVEIDKESKKRMKVAYVEFDEGEAPDENTPATMFANIRDLSIKQNTMMYEAKLEEMSEKLDEEVKHSAALSDDLANQTRALEEFKLAEEAKEREKKIQEIFSKFADLSGIDEFEALLKDHSRMDVDSLLEKCYAIRGKNVAFSLEPQSKDTKLHVEHAGRNDRDDEPYGGIFVQYGIEK